MKAKVIVLPKQSVLDPQGVAVRDAIERDLALRDDDEDQPFVVNGVFVDRPGEDVVAALASTYQVMFGAAIPADRLLFRRTDGQISPLLDEHTQPFAIALAMTQRRFGAVDFFLRVKYLKRKNRKSIQDQPGRFRMQFCTASGQIPAIEKIQKQPVTLLSQIVSPLVDAINQAFNAGNILICGSGGTGRVLGVPKLEIRQMLLRYRPLEPGK